MRFEIKSYEGDTVLLTATCSQKVPLDDLDDMEMGGLRFFWDGQQVNAEQVRIKTKIAKQDEEWDFISVTHDDDKPKQKVAEIKTEEQKIPNALDVEKLIQTENPEILESDVILDDKVVEESIIEAKKVTDQISEDIEKKEASSNLQPGIYVSKADDEGDSKYYPTIAAASRDLDIPAYKISDGIKLNKEVMGYTFRKVSK